MFVVIECFLVVQQSTTKVGETNIKHVSLQDLSNLRGSMFNKGVGYFRAYQVCVKTPVRSTQPQTVIKMNLSTSVNKLFTQ